MATSPLAQKLTSSEGLSSATSDSPRLDKDIFTRAQAKTHGQPVITNVEALREPGAQAALLELGFQVAESSPSNCNTVGSTHLTARFVKEEDGVSQSVNYDSQGTISLMTQTADSASIGAHQKDEELIVSFTAQDGKPAAVSNEVKATADGPI